MDYKFQCPKCNVEKIISMSMKDYHSDGHYCPTCGSEMERKISDYAFGAIWKTDGAYSNTTIR